MNHPSLIPITAPIDEVDDAPLRRFWWLRRIFWVTAIFIVFVIGSWFWLRHRAERRLAVEIQQWKKEGLPIEDKDFEQPPVPDEENAAVAFNRAIHENVDMRAWDNADNVEGFSHYPWGADTRVIADQTFALNHKVLEALRAARGLTKVHWDRMRLKNFDKSKLNPHLVDLSSIQPMANLIRTAAIAAHLRGDEAGFLEYLHDLQWIAEITARDVNLVSRLVAGGVDSIAAGMIGEVAGELRLDTPALRDETRARMAAWSVPDRLCNRWDLTAREGSFLLEQVEDADALAVFRDGHRTSSDRLEMATCYFLEPQRFLRVTNLLRHARETVHAAHQANWPALSNMMSNLPPPKLFLTEVEPARSLTWSIVPFEGTNDRLFKLYFERNRQMSIALLHLACRLYSIDHHGKNPTTLSELVPDYLPAIPVDPFSANGQVFRLHSATTQPFIYGLGVSSDLVAKGTWLPTLAQHEDLRSNIFVSFLNPYSKAAASQPSTRPGQ